MLDNSTPKPSQQQKGSKVDLKTKGVTKNTDKNKLGGKTQFDVLMGYEIDKSHAMALRVEANNNDFKKFYELTPYDYKSFAHNFYNYYRAEQHIIQQHKTMIESGSMTVDSAKKSAAKKLKALRSVIKENLEEARKDPWVKMATAAGSAFEKPSETKRSKSRENPKV